MRGADGVRDKIAALLTAELARKVPLLRAAWEQLDIVIPEIDKIISGETPDMVLESTGDTWVLVINPRFLNTKRVDIVDGQPVYMTRYSCRIYVWAKDDAWELAISARDNLAVACRLSLFQYPTLDNQVQGDTGYRLHENTYTEEFGEPLRLGSNKGRRVWAGAVLAIDVDCQETLEDGSTREPLGTAQEITTTATVVGPGQPLPEPS